MNDKHKRSLAKTITWRVFASTTTTITLVFLFTGELFVSLGVGITELIAKLIVYYLHERAWDRVSWGHSR